MKKIQTMINRRRETQTHPKLTYGNSLENNKLIAVHEGQDHNITEVCSFLLQHSIDLLPRILHGEFTHEKKYIKNNDGNKYKRT